MFSIKLLFLGDPVIRDIYTQRRIFAPPPPWPACVDLNKAAIQKERWETIGFWRFFSIFTHHFFNKIAIFGRSRDLRYLSSQAYFCPAATVDRSRLSKQSGVAKRTVRNDWVLTFLQFFYSPFFQLNCYFWGDCVIWDISAHRGIFAPPPPWLACVYQNKAAMQKERWETIGFRSLYSSFTNHFFN